MKQYLSARKLRSQWVWPFLSVCMALLCAAPSLLAQGGADEPTPPRVGSKSPRPQESPTPEPSDPVASKSPTPPIETEGDTSEEPTEGTPTDGGAEPDTSNGADDTDASDDGTGGDGDPEPDAEADGGDADGPGDPEDPGDTEDPSGEDEVPDDVTGGPLEPGGAGNEGGDGQPIESGEPLSNEDQQSRHRALVHAEGRRLAAGRRDSMLDELDILTAPAPLPPDWDPTEDPPPAPPRDVASILESLTRLAQTSRIELAACQRELAGYKGALVDATRITAKLHERLGGEPADVRQGRRLISEALLSIEDLSEQGLRHEQTFNSLRDGLGDIDDTITRYEDLLARANALDEGLADAQGSAEAMNEARRLATETVANLRDSLATAHDTKTVFVDTLSAASKNVALSADLAGALSDSIHDAQELSLAKRDPIHLRLATLRQARSDTVAGVERLGAEIRDGAWLQPLRDQGNRLVLLVFLALLCFSAVYAVTRPVSAALEEAVGEEQTSLWRRRQKLRIARSGIIGVWFATMSWACLFPVYGLWLLGVVCATAAAWLTCYRALKLLLSPDSSHRLLLSGSSNVRPVFRALVALVTATAAFVPAELSFGHTNYGAPDVIGLTYLLHAFVICVLMIWLLRSAKPMVREDLDHRGRTAKLIGAAIPYASLVAVAVVGLQALGYTNLTRLVGRGLPMTGMLFYGLFILERRARQWLIARHPSPEGQATSRRSEVDDTLELKGVLWDLILGLERAAALATATWLFAIAWGLHRPHWNYINMLLSGSLVQVQEHEISLAGIVRAGIIVYLVIYTARLVKRLIEHSPALGRKYGLGVRYAASHLFLYVTCTLGVLWALMVAGLDLSVLTVFASMAGIGLGFGLQDVVRNFMAGLILLVERPMEVDDLVKAGDSFGYVVDISLRSTTLRTFDNRHIIVPNSTFIAENINNYSHRDAKLACDVDVGVSYGSDLPRVRQVLQDVAEADPYLLKEQPASVWIMGFGESSICFKLRVWVPRPDIGNSTRTRLILAIHHAFRINGIEIPYPQRDLHVRSVVPIPVSEHHGPYGIGSPPPSAPMPDGPTFIPEGGVWDIDDEGDGE